MDSRHDSFIFNRDYIKKKLLTKIEATFFQDLLDIAANSPTIEDWFECSVARLEASMKWSQQSQKDFFSKLIKKGYVKTEKRGIPPKRWVWIDIDRIETDLGMKEDA